MAKGIIKRFDFRKGFGFIVDDKSGEDFFFHKTAWQGNGQIRQGVAVEFVTKDSEKGPQADNVMPLDGGKGANQKGKPNKASMEDRVASLESSLTTWKIISSLALAGVIILGLNIIL
ncbi:cold-shock protein [Thiomicrorhabdus sp. Milos-T2]|uniref:cold-shock protein n=1 Tax=Thiomicrorhabdus sp. Milos-T2 TaxID=90814 RepID=UPI000A029550|nr:cold shock domain-containing protein [Thiomicrorhabdus sp. Milos-T2]